MTDKERIRFLERELSVCGLTVKRLNKEILVLKQEIFSIDPNNPIININE